MKKKKKPINQSMNMIEDNSLFEKENCSIVEQKYRKDGKIF